MPSSRLANAVSDAELLVEFAARNGIEIDSELVNAVTATRVLLEKGTATETQEAAFFEAYIKLSHALGKVTVSSIRDSRDELGDERPKYFWFGAPHDIFRPWYDLPLLSRRARDERTPGYRNRLLSAVPRRLA